MKKPLFVILDAGHGGIKDGVYTTAPSKMHQHTDGSIAYEGVINRSIKDVLKNMLTLEKIEWLDVAPTADDLSLKGRVDAANAVMEKNGNRYNYLYLSIHSNAGGGTGFEVWTSQGETMSDKYAEQCSVTIKKMFPSFAFRADTTDGDLDKESKFYVLIHTKMPAILVEALFFDNPKDWAVQQAPSYPSQMAAALLLFIKRSLTAIP